MESRKYQLQQQILEALKANDKDLYSLLKSQWAHRFGVESLKELDNLDFNEVNQKSPNEVNQNNESPQDSFVGLDNEISIKDNDDQKKELILDTQKIINSVEVENKESGKIKLNEKIDKENNSINIGRDYKKPPKVNALIPLPPKPKYSYLRKWIVRN